MKKTNKAILLGLVSLTITVGCRKDSGDFSEKKNAEKIKVENLTKYISITIGVTPDQIIYDNEEKVFYVKGTIFRETMEAISSRYQLANEYKETYEK